jgi:hypothetical protein
MFTLIAGRDISNVDAVVPTNARMPGKDSSGSAIAPNAASLVELGGGDLLVQAGRDINGGVCYVERGQGVLRAGGSIHSNFTRSTLLGPSVPTSDPTTEQREQFEWRNSCHAYQQSELHCLRRDCRLRRRC